MTVDGWQIKRTKEIAQIGTVDAINAGYVIRDDNLLKGVAGTGQLLGVKAKYVVTSQRHYSTWCGYRRKASCRR